MCILDSDQLKARRVIQSRDIKIVRRYHATTGSVADVGREFDLSGARVRQIVTKFILVNGIIDAQGNFATLLQFRKLTIDSKRTL